MKRLLICAALLIATLAHAENVFEDGVCDLSDQRFKLGCAGSASPAVVAALRKRFPDVQEKDEDVWAFVEIRKGKRRYSIAFSDSKWHKTCRLTLNPIRFSNCRIRHA